MRNKILKRIFALTMHAYLLGIILLSLIDNGTVYEPAFLLPVLNTLFIGLLPIAVAVLAAYTYWKTGQYYMLFFGSGMLMYGLGSILAGWFINLPGGPNLSVSMSNISSFFGALFHILGSVLIIRENKYTKKIKVRKGWGFFFYAMVFAILAASVYLDLNQLIPSFFIGSGPTSIRQALLGLTILLYAFSANLLFNLYHRNKSEFLHWYFMTLFFIAIGLLAVLIEKAVGSPIGWLGRSAQYIGGICASFVVISVFESSTGKGWNIEQIVASFFNKAEASYKNLVDTAIDAIVSIDKNENIVLWNPAAERIIGYSLQEALGLSFYDAIFPEKYSNLREDIDKNIAEDNLTFKLSDEMELIKKDGSLLSVEYSMSLQGLDENCIATFIFRDITKRKHAEEALRLANEELETHVLERTEELSKINQSLRNEIAERIRMESELRDQQLLMQRIIDNTPSLVYVFDDEGRCILANRNLALLFKADRESMLGFPRQNWIFEEIADSHRLNDLMVIETRKPANFEEIYDAPDGRHTFLTTKFPIFDVVGNVKAVGGISTDITERKKSEEQLKELNLNLKNLVEDQVNELIMKDRIVQAQSRLASMGEMISNIAHQWKQPLNVLSLIIQNFRIHFNSGDLDKTLVGKMSSEGMNMIWHMSQTVDDFRNFFKPDKERVEFYFKNMIERTISFIEAGYKDNNIELTLNIEEDIKAEGFPNEYSQVLINILNNAKDILIEKKIKNPWVRIALSKEGGKAVVTITDNGGGIAPENMPRIFEPYFTTKPTGTGIGLYMSKTIIEKNMGGKISVRNSKDGAEFRIEI